MSKAPNPSQLYRTKCSLFVNEFYVSQHWNCYIRVRLSYSFTSFFSRYSTFSVIHSIYFTRTLHLTVTCNGSFINKIPTKLAINKNDLTSEIGIANEFKKFFTNIGPEFAEKIPTASRIFESFLNKIQLLLMNLKKPFFP